PAHGPAERPGDAARWGVKRGRFLFLIATTPPRWYASINPPEFPHAPLPTRSTIDMKHLLLATFASLCATTSATAGELPRAVRTFIEKRCLECHDAGTARAGFRIDLLTDDFTAGNNAGLWKEVMDRINTGEMPPKKKPRPEAKEIAPVTA